MVPHGRPGPCFSSVAMKLYAYRYCPFSRRVRIALAEHGCEFEYVEQPPLVPYPAELRGKVPGDEGVPVLFVRDDFVLWDSTAIIHWVDSAYPRSLYPSARDPQALARAWQAWISSKLYPKVTELREGDDTAKQQAEAAILDALRMIESKLERHSRAGQAVDNDWLIGTEFSVADVALGPVVGELSSKAIETLPARVREYVGRLRSRPSVREVCELDLAENNRPSAAA